MPVQKVITSPHRFKERILAYGGAGTGKSSLTLNMARYMPDSTFHVIDMDYSMSYERIMATEYPDVMDRGNVVVHEIDPEWDTFADKLAEIIATGDHDTDVLTIDPATVTWEIVQAWWIDSVQGTDIADFMAELRRDTKDSKEYAAALAETMQWPAINKQYQQKFYRRYHAWRGHAILVCEAAEVGRGADNDEKALYGHIGFKPKGQKTLPHVSSTNLFLDHPKRDVWRMTSVKDRGRTLMDKQAFDEFAIDYLVDTAGWEMEMRKG